MSLAINKKVFSTEELLKFVGLVTESWLDGNPKIRYVTDKDNRKRRIRTIVAHTHEGKKGNLLPGTGPNTTIDTRLAMYQTDTTRYVSWDYTIDSNGDITAQNDPGVHYTWQAGMPNGLSLGFEMIQELVKNAATGNVISGDLYETQIAKTVLLIDLLTGLLGIQRQIPVWKNQKPIQGVCERAKTCEDVVGIIGHRNITGERGPGDPGDHIFFALQKAGYELFDCTSNEDLNTWKDRQIKLLGFQGKDVDGVALDKTVAALKAINGGKDYPLGLWVKRPIDAWILKQLS